MRIQKQWRMIPHILIMLVILQALFYFPAVAREEGKQAVNGLLDLRTGRTLQEAPLTLNGEWAFYWKELLTAEQLSQADKNVTPTTVTVPDTWSNYDLDGQALPKFGFASYHLTVLLNEQDVGQHLALYIPSIATAYNLWVNGELITSNGKVGQNRAEMIPKNYAKTAVFQADSTKLDLLIQVSNFHQRKSGLWEPLTLGTLEQIQQLRERNILFQMFVIGCIFIIGFYQLVFFLQYPREYSPFFLAMACFGITLRTLLLKDTLLIYLFPQINWELAVTLEYLSALFALLFFLLFVKQELASDLPKGLTNVFVVLVAGYGVFVAVTPARIFTNSFLFFQVLAVAIMLTILIVYLIALKRKREGAYLNLVAILVLFAAVLNDIFYYSHWIQTNEFISIGLLFYLYTQSVHLARRFSRSFEHVERLSHELKELNQSLERKVGQRTEELREANQRLQKVEESRRRLLASVSHELKTPLTFIQGYIKAMMDGVISKDDSTYLRSVYRDTQMMARMIQDLQELSKLESGQVTFQYERVEIRTFLKQLYEEQKPIVEEKGLYLEYVEKLKGIDPEDQVICLLDPVRIKQTYLNLIINAEKFTPPGGSITIELEMFPTSFKEVRINIKDTGHGIAEKDLPYIFERFYKANHHNKQEQRGAGLGLAIAKEIVEYHQGYVGVYSEIGKGSVFYFTLPIQTINSIQWKEG